jgi:diguanylate cyclase (GGDEF)-like protein
MREIDFSPIAVTFQCIGTLLIALMMAQLGRMFAWRYAWRWAFAWTSFFFALIGVRAYITTGATFWWIVYLIGEWSFLVLLYAGCRELSQRGSLSLRPFLYALPAATALAIAIAHFATTFNMLFIGQAALVSIGACVSFVSLGRFEATRRTAGWQIMRLSLAMTTILYAAYVPLFALHSFTLELPFLAYSSLGDLLGSIFLGFGMILITSEEAHAELRGAMTALQGANAQLAAEIRIDPLTEALSRHAFHSLRGGDDATRRQRAVKGVVAMIDIDHLKQINDHSGHIAGDAVIRAAANAVRAQIRADDLLFRWGGDEFLLVVPGSSCEQVMQRLEALGNGLTCALPQSGRVLDFSLSWGCATFDGEHSLDEALRAADEAMYERRSRARA